MTRKQYVNYLRQQVTGLEIIAEILEKDGNVDDLKWLVDMPIVTEFDEAPKEVVV